MTSSPGLTRPTFEFAFAGRTLRCEDRALVMGILNVTPDSFSDGNQFFDAAAAIRRGVAMAEEGADLVDVGGESTRPGSLAITAAEELRRVAPVIEELAGRQGLLVSIDTQKSEVAAAALAAGAVLVNDISALRTDPRMPAVVRDSGAPVCLMHMLGTPRDMQRHPSYEGDVVREILAWLAERVEYAVSQGIAREKIIVDPGLGFGKRPEHNLELVKRIGELHELGLPVLVGHSRKSTLGVVLDEPVDGRLYGSLAVAAVCVMAGVQILRVHDVKATLDVVKTCEAIGRGICFNKS